MMRKKCGQSVLEYALLISVAIAAFMAVGIYMRRGIAGRMKESADQIGRQFGLNANNSNFTFAYLINSTGNTTTTENRTAGSGNTTTIIAGDEITRRSEFEWWGSNISNQSIY